MRHETHLFGTQKRITCADARRCEDTRMCTQANASHTHTQRAPPVCTGAHTQPHTHTDSSATHTQKLSAHLFTANPPLDSWLKRLKFRGRGCADDQTTRDRRLDEK